MRFFITLSYDGTRYHGWQIQPNGDSIQQRLQEALSTLFRQPIEVVGAGRTDTGVHAKKMVAHFTIEDSKMEIESTSALELCQDNSSIFNLQSSIKYRLNKLLPHDIAVQEVRQVPDDMHARFSATERTYHYYIHTHKDPFQQAYSWQVNYPLDFTQMNEAAKVLLEYKDFTSFSKVNTDTRTNICDLRAAHWDQLAPSQWRFTIRHAPHHRSQRPLPSRRERSSQRTIPGRYKILKTQHNHARKLFLSQPHQAIFW